MHDDEVNAVINQLYDSAEFLASQKHYVGDAKKEEYHKEEQECYDQIHRIGGAMKEYDEV